MPNGRSRGRRRGRRPKRRSNEKGGRTVQTAAPALFAFMGPLSSDLGLSVWLRFDHLVTVDILSWVILGCEQVEERGETISYAL